MTNSLNIVIFELEGMAFSLSVSRILAIIAYCVREKERVDNK